LGGRVPPLPKGTELKPPPASHGRPSRRRPAAKSAATRTRQAPAKGKVQPAANGADDKARMRLAAQVVQLREEERLSWLKIGARLKLGAQAERRKAAASRARTLYRLVKVRTPTLDRCPSSARTADGYASGALWQTHDQLIMEGR
jgi:hypothetical protein